MHLLLNDVIKSSFWLIPDHHRLLCVDLFEELFLRHREDHRIEEVGVIYSEQTLRYSPLWYLINHLNVGISW